MRPRAATMDASAGEHEPARFGARGRCVVARAGCHVGRSAHARYPPSRYACCRARCRRGPRRGRGRRRAAAGRRRLHRRRDQPGVRRRRQQRRDLQERLHRALQPGRDRRSTSPAGASSTPRRPARPGRRRPWPAPIAAGGYYLVKEAAGAGGTVDLPTPNATGTIPMSATTGKVALVEQRDDTDRSCPTGLVDFVGYGARRTASRRPPTPACRTRPRPCGTRNGATDTDNNSADFTIGAPNPRNAPPPDGAPAIRLDRPRERRRGRRARRERDGHLLRARERHRHVVRHHVLDQRAAHGGRLRRPDHVHARSRRRPRGRRRVHAHRLRRCR